MLTNYQSFFSLVSTLLLYSLHTFRLVSSDFVHFKKQMKNKSIACDMNSQSFVNFAIAPRLCCLFFWTATVHISFVVVSDQRKQVYNDIGRIEVCWLFFSLKQRERKTKQKKLTQFSYVISNMPEAVGKGTIYIIDHKLQFDFTDCSK